MVSATDGWACGSMNLKPAMLHYSGGHWRDATASIDTRAFRIPQAHCSNVRMASATSGWAWGKLSVSTTIGDISISEEAQRTGGNQPNPFADMTLNALSVVSDHEIWMVGYTRVATWKTLIVRDHDHLHRTMSLPVSFTNWDTHSWDVGAGTLTGVSMLSSTDGWASGGGTYGEGILFHWDGEQWSPEASYRMVRKPEPLQGMMTGANTAWVYGAYAARRIYLVFDSPTTTGLTIRPGDRDYHCGRGRNTDNLPGDHYQGKPGAQSRSCSRDHDMKNGSLLPGPSPTP